jgi:hypothetical protein
MRAAGIAVMNPREGTAAEHFGHRRRGDRVGLGSGRGGISAAVGAADQGYQTEGRQHVSVRAPHYKDLPDSASATL